ncbi:hypothetical protein cypCar_00040940 [Cyprinus carpio]|nr:hypothetical protein cypCar_00040940 [Cyprinus carpio]
MDGPIAVEVPVSRFGQPSLTQWTAVLERSVPNPTGPRALSVTLSSPATASIGVYTLQLRVEARLSVKTHLLGQFTLLCNPWCEADSVFLQSEDLRTEYVKSDIGCCFKAAPEHCLADPGRLISMKRDTGHLYEIAAADSVFLQSEDLRTEYVKSDIGCCFKAAPEHCLADPGRLISMKRDTGHLYEIAAGEPSIFKQIWVNSNDDKRNFHVWVESWMKRPDLSRGYDGWQVLDPTPQERSEGMFRCGPAAVKAVYEQKVDAQYDVPFVYAEVNADVRVMIVRDRTVLSTSVDKRRVGALISTKRPGSMSMQDVTSEYKTEKDTEPIRAAGGFFSKGTAVSLQLLKPPVVGENISFNVIITNNEAAQKLLKKHVNAQNKEYNRNPTGTFWEAHDDVKIGPKETVTIKHEISFKEYMLKETAEDSLVNLAVVIEDVKSQERVLASEEFNISTPSLDIQIQNEVSVIINAPQVATVSFTNPFNVAVSGELSVSGSGLLEKKAQMSLTIQPRETIKKPVNFTPRMAGARMLSANLVLENPSTVLHGFKTINVQAS